jgi:hypothetical protein
MQERETSLLLDTHRRGESDSGESPAFSLAGRIQSDIVIGW